MSCLHHPFIDTLDSLTSRFCIRISESGVAFMTINRNVLTRLRAEYLEMPGLRLTTGQVQRFCGIERVMCQSVLDALVDVKFLCVNSDGTYVRSMDGELIPRQLFAKARLDPDGRARKAS